MVLFFPLLVRMFHISCNKLEITTIFKHLLEKKNVCNFFITTEAALNKIKVAVLNIIICKKIPRKKNKTILNFSLQETDSKMQLELEEEVTIYCEENEDTDTCAYEDYEMELDYNLINIGDFILANVSSSVNSKKVACIIFSFLRKRTSATLVFQKSYVDYPQFQLLVRHVLIYVFL